MERDDYNIILSKIKKVICEQSQDFNIFEMLGQSTRELTHSIFLAQMLNPNGQHSMGSTFLKLFIEELDISDFSLEGVEVEIEKDCGPKTGCGLNARGGRIDIFLRNSKNKEIVIENKIYAADQRDQLQRYRNSTGPESVILYLTLDGHEPANTPQSVNYQKISYKKDIVKWLNKCLETCKNNFSLYNIISQYMDTIKNLTADQEVTKIIQSSSINLRASLQIARLADKARNNLKKEFLEDLADHLNIVDREVKEVGKEWRIQTKDCEWCIEHNLFIRFLNSGENNIPDGNLDWEYVNFSTKNASTEKINFHELNYPASLWLDNRAQFWSEFTPILQTILSRYGLK